MIPTVELFYINFFQAIQLRELVIEFCTYILCNLEDFEPVLALPSEIIVSAVNKAGK